MLHATKRKCFVSFLLLLEIPLQVFQIILRIVSNNGLPFFSFGFIIYLYFRTSHVSGWINALTRYHGKGSYSICMDMLCVSIRTFGAIWFIYFILFIYIFSYRSYLNRCPPLQSSWFIFSCCSICDSLGVTFGGMLDFIFSCVSIGVSLGTTLGGLLGFLAF